jgi:hypothetical protein
MAHTPLATIASFADTVARYDKLAANYLAFIHPRGKPPQISPIFTSEKVTPTVLREKDEKSGLLYAQIGRFQNRPASRGACAPVPRRYV